MKGLEKLMSKWWFRLILVAGLAIVLLFVNLFILTKAGNTEKTHYANDGVLNISGWLIYLSIVPMYLATDILNNMRFKIGKLFRALLLIASFLLCIIMVLVGLINYLKNAKDGDVMRPVFDGFGLAPFLTYTLLYHFVVGRFESAAYPVNGVKRRIQFFVTLLAYILPIILGMLLVLILKSINSTTVLFIALIAIPVLLVGSFVVSIRKYGLLLGGSKEFEREKPVSSSSSSSASSGESNDWTSEFENALNRGPYGTYVEVDAYATLINSTIYINLKLHYYGSSNPEIIASRNKEIVSEARSIYSRVAKKCPYASKMNIELK